MTLVGDGENKRSQPRPIGTPAAPTAPKEPAADPGGFLSSRPARHAPESVLVRVVATAGIVGIGTGIGAAMGAAGVDAWIGALIVALVSVVLAAVLWRSRVL